MAGANPERTSWVSDTAPLVVSALWAKPLAPYVPLEAQPIAADGKIFVSTAAGLYAFNNDTGALVWTYPTALPLGHSPTYASGVLYVGGFDRRIHAVNATTGASVWISASADGAFENNPVVVGTRVFAGNRDGYFYAFLVSNGTLSWRYKTDAPIRQSAAYKDGVLFFGSMDNHAYALSETGALVWKSATLPGMGFYAMWPVIYEDTVIFMRAPIERGLIVTQASDVYATASSRDVPGVLGTEPGDWTTGEPTFNIATNPFGMSIPNYFEAHPERREMFVLNQSTGAEVSYDMDADGTPDAAPFLHTGEEAGTTPPPVVSGYDGVLYVRMWNHAAASLSAIPGARLSGWKVGTPHLSLPVSAAAGQSGHWPADEPSGFTGGGSTLYWNHCCDWFIGAADLSIANTTHPNVNSARQRRYTSASPTACTQTGYPDGYDVEKTKFRWHTDCALFWGQVNNTGPVIYDSKFYVLRSNALIAFDAAGTGNAAPTLSSAPVVAASSVAAPVSPSTLQARLEAEIAKMRTAGHLRSAYSKIGNLESSVGVTYDDNMADLFHNPADTITILIRALPHLSAGEETATRTYLQSEFAAFPPYTYTHLGFQSGAQRDNVLYPAADGQIFTKTHAAKTTSSPFTGWAFPPHNIYAVWKYAQAGLGTAATLFTQVQGKLGTTPSDAYLAGQPHVHNAYIAGYHGYVELAKLAGQPYATQQTELDRLKALRLTNWTLTPTPTVGGSTAQRYFHVMIHSWNFLYMTPELADFLYTNLPTQMQQAFTHYTSIAPYWMWALNEETQAENGVMPYQQTHALFQALAQVLNAPQEELTKHLDSAQYPVGDLYYIDNLVAALEAKPTNTTTPKPPTNLKIVGQ
jgi:outer membrane protein assembly factor BamB